MKPQLVDYGKFLLLHLLDSLYIYKLAEVIACNRDTLPTAPLDLGCKVRKPEPAPVAEEFDQHRQVDAGKHLHPVLFEKREAHVGRCPAEHIGHQQNPI